MNRRIALVCVALVLIAGSVAFAQTAKTAASASGAPDKATLEQVLAAWASKDVGRAAAFYAKDPGLAYYDIAPRKYDNWAEYAKGATEMFKTIKSLTFQLGPDAQVHHSGDVVWTTATVDGTMVNQDGSSMKIDGRWTTVWQKRGTKWLIVHDHFSMPLPEPPKK